MIKEKRGRFATRCRAPNHGVVCSGKLRSGFFVHPAFWLLPYVINGPAPTRGKFRSVVFFLYFRVWQVGVFLLVFYFIYIFFSKNSCVFACFPVGFCVHKSSSCEISVCSRSGLFLCFVFYLSVVTQVSLKRNNQSWWWCFCAHQYLHCIRHPLCLTWIQTDNIKTPDSRPKSRPWDLVTKRAHDTYANGDSEHWIRSISRRISKF